MNREVGSAVLCAPSALFSPAGGGLPARLPALPTLRFMVREQVLGTRNCRRAGHPARRKEARDQPRPHCRVRRLLVGCQKMPEIVLTTLNTKYIHAAFGLRYLMANLGPLQTSTEIVEFDINQRPLDITDALLARHPQIIGFGVYIWNVAQTTQVVAAVKKIRPDLVVILGGPEVSYETESQTIAQLSDYVICGEADLKFAEVCQELMQGRKPAQKIITSELPDFSRLALPYHLYNAQDIAHRIIYVEASRGCPFSCEFCLSSLDIPVRQVPLPVLLKELQGLLDRGVKQFKFVDRTFNLNLTVSRALLEFFLERHQPGHFYHFEMIPDRLPPGLREIISRFPAGSLQFEVGIQTFNPEVANLISRRQDYPRLEENLHFLHKNSGVHVHADLIAGLPGETLASFAAGFDRLVALGPQEIQVGILKRLRGTPIARHDSEWQMLYDSSPPYEILQNRLIDFSTMHTLRRFARVWDLIGNSGNFVESAQLIWSSPETDSTTAQSRHAGGSQSLGAPSESAPTECSPFYCFLRWTEWLQKRVGRRDGIALVRLTQLLFEYLTAERGLDPRATARALWRDYQRGGRTDKPIFLREFITDQPQPRLPASTTPIIPKRQARHVSGRTKEPVE
jgi:radical SAM superfamily enzyme YgiQ (UPF0313 family)